jgi:hypothetical protein
VYVAVDGQPVDKDCQPVEEQMPTPLLSVPRVHLRDISKENLCLVRQALFSLSCPERTIYENLPTFL